MQNLMPPIGTPDNLFHDGNPLTGEQGTIVTAAHLNNEQGAIRDVQSELISILAAASMEPESKAGQLLAALNKLYTPNNKTMGALASLSGAANKLPYFTGPAAASVTELSSVGRDIISKYDVASVLSYLGLGGGAKLAAASAVFSTSGRLTLPTLVNGIEKNFFIQWGQFYAAASAGVGTAEIAFPVAFPTAFLSATALMSTNDPSIRSISFDLPRTTTAKICFNYVTPSNNPIFWIAIGY